MSKNLFVWIACVVAADIVVTLFFIARYLAKQKANLAGYGGAAGTIAGASAAIPSFLALRKFTDAIHPRIGGLVRSSWSGDADSLPSVLTMALDEAQREAQAQGLALDRDVLKKVVEVSLAKHHVTKGAVLREALQKVA